MRDKTLAASAREFREAWLDLVMQSANAIGIPRLLVGLTKAIEWLAAKLS